MTKLSLIWISAAFALALFAGPIAFIASQAGKADASHVYLIIGWGEKTQADQIASFGARHIGPNQKMLSQMVEALPEAQARLTDAGYVLLPASALAALCGAQPRAPDNYVRNS